MASGRQATKPQQQAAEQDFDPKYEWQENAASFVLRLHLSEGFRKEDFRVQVDGTGRLTVRSQRADGGKHSRFSKTFQLPAASNLDAIAGRFDAGVLTLTVPKKVVDDAKPKEDTNNAVPPPPQGQGKPREDKAKKPEAERKEAAEMTTAKKPKDDAKPKEDATTNKKPPAAEQQQVDAKRGKPEQEQPKAAAPPATVRKEEAKPAAEAAAPPAADKEEAAPKPPQADAERKAVDPESLAAVTAKRRAEEERAKAAAAAEEAERQRTRRGLRERVQEELDGLAGSEWAEGLMETVKKNKEVIATAVAAFSLGLVASRLFCRN
ncbi:brain acid soluble protein 1-like [Panicum miliaceum]|uniref:Brain acid soluble protein 1-like n=1 Tax=Panicum miliaceum TaxID=4540 RepID=A0A3L6SX93_PANMI|nr:brain acid soluble protein 1-like [Panicum miliaceum]